MFPKYYEISNFYDVGSPLRIFLLDMSQDLDLHKCLLTEFLPVLYHLQSQLFLFLVVIDFEHLPIGTLPDKPQNLEPVGDVVMQDEIVLFSALIYRYY